MLKIAHRGNINGRTDLENKPEYILNALSKGYDVEIDIWFTDSLYLGHDEPQYKIEYEFLLQSGLWIHCKNIKALNYLKDNNNAKNYFYHNVDDVTLTSKGLFWTYPGKELTKYSIAVMPEIEYFFNLEICLGVCSDYIINY